MPKIHPRQIEAFRAVMITQSITRSAAMVGVTQPAVSRLIRDLEAETKLTLFRRSGNRLTPTKEATLLFQEVDRFYVGLDHIGSVAETLRTSESGSIRVAASNALANSCVIQIVMSMLREKPGLEISVDGLDSKDILRLVSIGHYDLGVVTHVSTYPGITYEPLTPVPVVCVVPRNSPLDEKEYVTPDDLAGMPFISVGRNTSTRVKIDSLFASRNLRPSRILETSLSSTALILVEEGVGCAIVDAFSGFAATAQNFSLKPFVPRVTLDAAIITPDHKQPSLLSTQLQEMIVDVFVQMSTDPRIFAGRPGESWP